MATAIQIPKHLTFEEFLAQIDEDIQAEWVRGEVILMSPVSRQHQRLNGFLASILRYFVEAHQLGEVFEQTFLMKLGPELSAREPDILFVANANLARVTDTYLDGPADLAVEVVSPESRQRDREVKFREYAQGGVREYWLLDPLLRQAEFFVLNTEGNYQLAPIDTEGRFHSVVLEGLWLDLNWLWPSHPTQRSVQEAWGLV